jgi:uncharacterized protein DUF3467
MSKATGPGQRAPLARYANYFALGHNAFEFMVDFGQFRPESKDVVLHTRIAFGPTYAKLFAGMLARAIADHEAEYGTVPHSEPTADPGEVTRRPLSDFKERAGTRRRRATKG